MTRPNHQQGVAILFSVLLVSIVLTISLSLMNITYKQILLSLLARDSHLAFYSADSALECVQYYNKHERRDHNPDNPRGNPFGYHDGTNWNNPDNIVWASLNCGNRVDLDSKEQFDEGNFKVTKFWVIYDDDDRPTCAEVEVKKGRSSSGNDIITAYGYNNYDPDGIEHCYLISDRTIQRTMTGV